MIDKLRVLKIIPGTIVDGPGIRTSIYFAGCKHFCQGCHNPESWNMNGGIEMAVQEILKVICENNFNITLTGGDPLFQNFFSLIDLLKNIKQYNYNVWLYTGFTFQQIMNNDNFKNIIYYIDAIVDGKFDITKKDDSLKFKGSSNQNIYVKTNNIWHICEDYD